MSHPALLRSRALSITVIACSTLRTILPHGRALEAVLRLQVNSIVRNAERLMRSAVSVALWLAAVALALHGAMVGCCFFAHFEDRKLLSYV